MNITKMNKFIKTMYDVSNVKCGYDYWYFKLLNLVINMFDYDNLPPGISRRDLEINLIMTGHAVIVAKKDGSLFTPLTNVFGYDEYYQPVWASFANPVVVTAKKYTIGKDCEIIYNNSLQDSIYYIKADSGLSTFVGRYARQLADVEATANIYSVNSRLVSIPVSNDNSVIESLKAFFTNLSFGKRAIVTDSNIIENFRNVDINRTGIKDGINDWLIARDKILEQFFRDLGIRMNNQKKAQVNSEEVESNDQLLLISADDMLKTRQDGIEKVNNMFGTNITVKLNPLYNIKNVEGGDTDVTTQSSVLSE
jgi:hypothetical protein